MRTTDRAHCSILADVFAHPGQLDVVDLVTGEVREKVMILDPLGWAQAHTGGPSVMTKPAAISTSSGIVTSYFRSLTRPLDANEMTYHIAVEFREQFSLQPTAPIISLSEILGELGVAHYVERSFRIGRWVVWIFFPTQVSASTARDLAYRLYATTRDRSVLDDSTMSVPILEDAPESLHVPLHFVGGSFFGRLHTLFSGQLEEADLTCFATYDPTTDHVVLCQYGDDKYEATLRNFVEAWWSRHGHRKLRAAALMGLMVSSDITLPGLDKEPSPHSKAIALGRLLQGLDGQTIAGRTLHVRPSGNSTVYWLT
ncbi:MAG: hypothetical protein RLY93_09645 [Sumerlaeia bacterium]